MKFIAKVKNWGNSKGIVIDNEIVKFFNLEENDYIKLEAVEKIEGNKKQITYHCKICEHNFVLNADEEIYCPACLYEGDLENLDEENKVIVEVEDD